MAKIIDYDVLLDKKAALASGRKIDTDAAQIIDDLSNGQAKGSFAVETRVALDSIAEQLATALADKATAAIRITVYSGHFVAGH